MNTENLINNMIFLKIMKSYVTPYIKKELKQTLSIPLSSIFWD